jgi:TolB-like protein/tetratricopeptide (TPR) repeat protein
MGEVAVLRFLKELRRRRVFRTAGLYVIGAWLLLQAANILFPGWGVPSEAIRFLFWAVLLGFPVALVFGWIFEITADGIRRTRPLASESEFLESLPLKHTDFLILAAFVVVVGAIVYDTTGRVLRTTVTMDEWRLSTEEIEPHSVAVLPFADLSAERDQEHFTDGISEEILNRLAAFGELKVIARTSSFAFKDSGYDIGRISGVLAVNYLLQGSVRRDGRQLRISAQLVDRSGVQVWAESFDRELGAIFALQEEIAAAVATSIVPRIAPPPPAVRLPDLEAYEAYLVGRELVVTRAQGWQEAALEAFDRAIALDPEFAEPYAERAIARAIGAHWDEDPEARIHLARGDAEQALALKPDSARGYAARALVLDVQDPDDSHADKEALLGRSLALDPNQVDALNWLNIVLAKQGREAEANEVLERALRIDPLAPIINVNLARGDIVRGEFARAERRLLRALEAPRTSSSLYFQLGGLYAITGRLVDAAKLQERRLLSEAAATGRPGLIGRMRMYATLGMREQAENWQRRNQAMYPDSMLGRIAELAILSLETGQVAYAEALAQVEELIATAGVALDRGPRDVAIIYGELLALAGQHEDAIHVLDIVLAGDRRDPAHARARLALAWALLQQGEHVRKAQALEPLEQYYHANYEAVRLKVSGGLDYGALSGGLAGYAMTMLLAGDRERALELLEEAAEAGWRGYYGTLPDPRWDLVRDEPKFQAVMARVKADLDEQRAELEAMEAGSDFIARFDAALAAHVGHDDEVPRGR